MKLAATSGNFTTEAGWHKISIIWVPPMYCDSGPYELQACPEYGRGTTITKLTTSDYHIIRMILNPYTIYGNLMFGNSCKYGHKLISESATTGREKSRN